MLRKTPLAGQLPPDKELASEGPEARRGAKPEVQVTYVPFSCSASKHIGDELPSLPTGESCVEVFAPDFFSANGEDLWPSVNKSVYYGDVECYLALYEFYGVSLYRTPTMMRAMSVLCQSFISKVNVTHSL